MKRCRICNEAKPLDDYYRAAGARDGHRSECKACNLAQRAARYRENPTPYIERATRWREANPERHRQSQRRYASDGRKREANRKSYLLRTHGLTLDEYERMLDSQGGACAICEQVPADIALHVDHDHATGAIRGLLCFRCNNALGDFADRPDRLVAALAYLERDEELAGLARGRALSLMR